MEPKYGEFSVDGKEYIIHQPNLPRPWTNMLTNGQYCALVSHTGGGYSFLESSGYGRITRAYPSQAILEDRPGRYVYVRDNDTGEYWTINWQPVQKPFSKWQCRHGLGYSAITSACNDVTGTITYLVPLTANLEMWLVTLHNDGNIPRNLGIFTYVEWSLGNYVFDLIESQFANLFNVVDFQADTILATKNIWNISHQPLKPHAPWDKWAFLSASFDVVSFDTSRENFIGMYNSVARPAAVERGQCSNIAVSGKDSVGVLHTNIPLDPGQTFEFCVVVGAAESKAEALAMARRHKRPETAREKLQELNQYWENYLSLVHVQTPDPEFNLSVNIWNQYQNWFISHWARMSSYYIGGGSIVGFRDSSQDILGILPTEPQRAKSKLKEIWRHQFGNGSCLHNWDPITDLGPKTGHSDDPLWPVQTTIWYLAETGDVGFLDEHVDFYDGSSGSVYEHLVKSIDYTLSRQSERGVPLMGAGDWNDGLDQAGDEGLGESVMTAEFLCWMLKEVQPICRLKGDYARAEMYNKIYETLSSTINQLFWDGEWYQRATTDEGTVIGSKSSPEGKIYLNAQTWAVMSGIAPPDRAVLCMDAVYRELNTEYGLALFLPAYTKIDNQIGIITMFAPGTKENAAIFNHPVCWAIIAESMLGRADRAYEYFRKSSFLTLSKNPETYKTEPYVFAEYVHGPDSPSFGQGEFTWTTGTAPWMWRACLDWILGIRPTLQGLLIDPCIPKSWDRFTARRKSRGAFYQIEVENPNNVSTGVRKIEVDGKPIDGYILPVFHDGATHHVKVIMGSHAKTEDGYKQAPCVQLESK